MYHSSGVADMSFPVCELCSMAVMGAVVVHKHLGIYIYGCGIKRASGFCTVDITTASGILLRGQLSRILEQCRGNP